MQSLRNKLSPSRNPSQNERDFNNHPMSDVNSHLEEDYPHPKNGTLKNEILTARSKMAKKKPPAPKDWNHPGDRRSYVEKPTTPSRDNDFNYPPKDYPGFQGNPASSQFNRRPYSTTDNYPRRNLTRQENEVMRHYDQTIAPYNQGNHGFLHDRYAK